MLTMAAGQGKRFLSSMIYTNHPHQCCLSTKLLTVPSFTALSLYWSLIDPKEINNTETENHFLIDRVHDSGGHINLFPSSLRERQKMNMRD